MTTALRLAGSLSTLLLSAGLYAGCGKSDQSAVAPAGTTVPPPVITTPPKAPPSFFRDHYAALDDCVHDWGYAQKCVPVPPGSAPHQAGANIAGPIYARNYREETQAQLRKEAISGGYAQTVPSESSDRSISKLEVKY